MEYYQLQEVEYMVNVFIAYGLSFGIPLIILGFGSMINETKATGMISFISLISFLAYFTHTGDIPFWILIVVLVILSAIFAYLYKGIMGGD